MTRRASAAVARLQRALAAASAGVWEWDAEDATLTLSEELRTLLGADPFEGPSDGELMRTALGRRDRVALGHALRDALGGDGAIGLDVLATCVDGQRLWLRVAGDVATATGDEALHASGVAYDVTERKRLELRLRLDETVSRALVRASSIDEAAPDILEAIARATDMSIAGLWVPADDGTLRCTAIWATAAARRAHPRFVAETMNTRLASGQGLVGRAWDARGPVWIESAAQQRGLVGPRAAFVRGLRSGVAIPLQAGEHTLGVIDLFSHGSRGWDQQLLDALVGLGNEFALFILRQAAEASVRSSESRQRLLVSLLQAQRESDDPRRVLTVAATTLGTHLGAAAVDVVEAAGSGFEVSCSWQARTQDAGAEVEADERLRGLGGSGLMERLREGQVTVFEDAAATEPGALADAAGSTGIGVPIMRGGRWRAAMVVHADTARRWTGAEIGLATDVAEHTWDALERARSRTELGASEARYRSTFENAAVGVGHLSPDGRWLRVNQRLCDISGHSEKQLLACTFADITHPDDVEAHRAQLARLLAGTHDAVTSEKRYVRADGSCLWVEVTTSLFSPPEPEPAYFISVVEDIEARKAAEARLRTALAVKDEFLGLVSHELRTPMTVILGMSELLAGGRLDERAARSVASDIAASAEDLNDLIESMLLLARLDRDEGHADEPLLMDRVAGRALRRQRGRDPSREYRLESGGDMLVEAHPGLVERIIANLLSNAAKYSRPGGGVLVRVEVTGGEVLVHVIDEGPAPSEDELERLFEPFYRSPRTVRAPGAGLGLSVVLRIAESFGGRAWASRTGEGGSDFGFALPQLRVPED